MHRVLLLFAIFIVTATAAHANVVRPMEASPSFGELQKTCTDIGGSFTKSPDNQGYACTTDNCDGNGGQCHVVCDNDQNCVGSTPTRIVTPVNLRGILQNGDNILRGVGRDDPGSKGSSSGPEWPDGPIF
jgi:hypothetical protein